MYFVGLSSDLTKPMEFRPVTGRNFSAPVTLADGKSVRIFINAQADKRQPMEIVVVDENENWLARAHVLNNTTQIFSRIGLLVNVTTLPDGESN